MDVATAGTDNAVQKLQQELFASRSAYATAQRSVVQLSGSFKDSQQEVEALKRALQRYNADAAELRTCKLKVEELEGTLLSQRRESKLLHSGRAVLDEEIKALRAENEAKSYEISSLQQTVALQKCKIEEQSTQILVLKNQISELEDEVAAAEADVNTARETLGNGSKAGEKQGLIVEVDMLRSENADLLLQLQLVKADHDKLAERVESFKETTVQQQTTALKGHPENDTTVTSTDYTQTDVEQMNGEDLRIALRHCLRLQEQYKNARESLLSANRVESLEAERLRYDVDALASSLKESESCCSAWQAQCMNALGQIERLKDMLGEGADWVSDGTDGDVPDAAVLGTSEGGDLASPEQPVAAGQNMTRGTGVSRSPEQSNCRHCLSMQREALKYAEKATALDLQLRAMCAELLRSTRVAGQIGRSTLPMLYSIESRLTDVENVS